ncbi:4-hydroxy-tetrahydrodipicolinate reductase [Paraperlucidibaca wandonensis]|uniref:4-hydroxy-tetrahydrodipicolinate reductase n=1 Tax=Paraperlucidibaca wandonensis TaxID=1268273 RepID=A0ABW3HJE0_9GAMM
MTRIAICGAAGRMGRALIAAVQAADGAELSAAIERSGSEFLGQDAGELAGVGRLNIAITDDLAKADFDVAIDFTAPAATLTHAGICQRLGRGLVIGTTGLSAEQKAELQALSAQQAMVYSGNYSVGVNVSLKMLELAAKAFGDTVDIDVLEAHHRHKVDAPSGTALMMGEAVASALGRDLNEVAVYARHGHTGARERQQIGFQTLRGGDTVGDHTVFFFGEGERVEVRHVATNRANFATGAVRSARWLASDKDAQVPALYSMQDVLGLA